MYVVAHSMDGLVCRSALTEKSNFTDSVKLFVSIPSPWGGEQLSKIGVQKSPAVIPSWKDVEPDSEFIKRIFSSKLDSSMRYYIFFGLKEAAASSGKILITQLLWKAYWIRVHIPMPLR